MRASDCPASVDSQSNQVEVLRLVEVANFVYLFQAMDRSVWTHDWLQLPSDWWPLRYPLPNTMVDIRPTIYGMQMDGQHPMNMFPPCDLSTKQHQPVVYPTISE